MLRRMTAAAAAWLIATTWNVAALSQDPADLRDSDRTPSTADEKTVEGTVVNVDEQERTITVALDEPLATDAQERTVTFNLAEDAEIFIGDINVPRASTIADLNAGQEVELAYVEGTHGMLILIRLVG